MFFVLVKDDNSDGFELFIYVEIKDCLIIPIKLVIKLDTGENCFV